MSEKDDGFEVRRIVVAIDSSAHISATLDAAAVLAARLHAQLEGLYVEDIDLARLAELPIGREISFSTGVCRDFTARELTIQYREQATVARRAIAAAAARARIEYVFRVARGKVDVEIISAAGDADLLVLGTGMVALGRRNRLGSTARAATTRAPRSVLIAKPGVHKLAAPMVYYDGSPGARRALAAAVRVAGGSESTMTVLLVAADLDGAAALRAEVTSLLSPLQVEPEFLQSPAPRMAEICGYVARAGADVLVISADAKLDADGDLIGLLETVVCPVLLVR